MPVKKAVRSSQQPRSLAHQRKRPASANLADSDTLGSAESKTFRSQGLAKQVLKARGVRRQPPSATKQSNLSVPVYSLAGRAAGTLTLPKEIFGQKVNKKLLSQAMRVYMTNQKSLTGFTKTRGEVEGSTAKIYRQKGTGRARHGGIRAPIFVGGGIVFGPKPRKIRLELPQRMKKTALLSAFSAKTADKQVMGLSGLEKASGKTKEMVELLTKIAGKNKNTSSLIVTGEQQNNVVRAVRNIPGADILPVNLINVYEVLKHDLLFMTKEAVEKLSKPVKGQK
ncbi:MAG: 50S ribosomal protein L4 [Candidatus Daviesbacteria bacterium]|nr:50S ribosomal protein L4 [Candidatus Daviesbacteria bacterium]